ncbi:sulfate/molybdate ABC transporter ATP-binding protein [Citricoccus sp.]|uniref:sulfate/molybdate ABC transporter ATP-binding protein n=1 Tax=Citricoccus sp. TaxID=1978372 RepID=UPI002604A8E4|nr:ATP-binding cassette domain-containing protein [Citricoccus sp.]HRO29986.1 ATP-binding cassette domain-containing protein [Citricoccus sp.]
MTGLDCRVVVPEREVDVAFTVPQGQTLALLGANGAGKSTVLDALAGWLRPESGYATLGTEVLFDGGTWVPARHRRVGYLAQDARLFPHLSAEANVAYGLDRAGVVGRSARRRVARKWLERVGVGHLAGRRPHQLSGGQAQRTAIARVLASDPRLVLLDEPLSSLDAQVVPQVRALLAEVLTGRTTVLVTHHAADAEALAHSTHRIARADPVRPPTG